MHQILVYGDSLSWGIIPNTRNRLPFHQRWPMIMESALIEMGKSVRIIEDCLNGRRTVLEDPFKEGEEREFSSIQQCVEANSPLALILLFLGTNDFQSMHQFNAWNCAQGIAAIIGAVRQAPIEPGMPSRKSWWYHLLPSKKRKAPWPRDLRTPKEKPGVWLTNLGW